MAEDSGYKVIGMVEDADYSGRLEAEAKKKEKGIYSRTIFIGIGGTGAKSLLHLRRLILERFGRVDALEGVAFVSIDTDIQSQAPSAEEERKNPLENALRFEKDERVNVKIDFKNYVGPNIIHHPQIREWWDEAALPSDDFNLEKGAGQIRPLSRLGFFANKLEIQDAISRAYRKVSAQSLSGERVDTASPVRVVLVTGLAGGTGSGMLLDLAALVQVELQHQERPVIEGVLVLPGGFGSVEKGVNFPKLAANGYAALRELNHYLTHPFDVQWEATGSREEVRGLFNRYVLFSGTNYGGEQLADLGDCYRTIGEILFLDFGAGPMAGWVQGVRINREQYLNSGVTYTYRLPQADGSVKETHTDEWRNAFSSVGLSKLVFPSWRLINKAKYELAAEMVGLLDPGRLGELSDVITRHRDRFMFDCGFFQGERETDDGRRAHWQVRNRLAQQTGAGNDLTTIYEHITRFQHELAENSESMYTEHNTQEETELVWKRLATLWGDPTSPGSEGDWSDQVKKNRRDLIREVERTLPKTVEFFRRKPAVGISGVVAILKDILEQLDRPGDQARYLDFFKQQRPRLDAQMTQSKDLWKKRVEIAEQASRGFGRSQENHRKALHLAGEALGDYWRARVNDYICEEGIKALEQIRALVSDQVKYIERIAERMHVLESQYKQLAAFYSRPQKSHMIRELEVNPDEDLLEPYLGRQADVRQERLEGLLDRGLRAIGVETLEALGNKLAGEFEQFRDHLSAQAFYALRGENGRTIAFTDNPEESLQGFIERYSIFKVLRESLNETQRRDLFEQLYRKGMPWASKNQTHAIVNLHEPHGDAFLGCIIEGFEEVADEMEKRFERTAETRFLPLRVRSYDPSEIIFYTELTAFPVYYLSEVSNLERHYERLLHDPKTRTPLHIHQDYHQFQGVLPFDTGEVANLQKAWSLFLRALMLGLICSVRQRADDEKRVAFQWRRKVGPFEIQWTDLGAEGQALERLMKDQPLIRQLGADLEDAEKKLQQTAQGTWSHLVALAYYYYYCVFPVRNTTRTADARPLGSMQNLVAYNLRLTWQKKEADGTDVQLKVKELLESLARWSRPIYRDPGQIVPRTAALKSEDRMEEWQLLGLVEQGIRTFIANGDLKDSRDARGQVEVGYPYLCLDWDALEKPAAPAGPAVAASAAADGDEEPPPLEPPPPAGEFFHYARDGERQGKLSAEEVARQVQQHPEGEHKVWIRDFGSAWKRAQEVPAIADLLEDVPPPLT